MDWLSHLKSTAAHLVLMAHTTGWQEHAKQRRDELLADPMYQGLRELIVLENKKAKADRHVDQTNSRPPETTPTQGEPDGI